MPTTHLTRALSAVLLVLLLGGCMTPQGSTPTEKRESVLRMRDATLLRMYRERPGLELRVAAAPGYAVFSNFGLKIFVAGGGNGYGVVHDNRTEEETFMRMGQVNLGLGIGGKDFRALFIFNNHDALRRFITSGWEFGGTAEAVAVATDGGGEVGVSGSVQDIDVYQITNAGLSLQAMVGGTKFWRDDELNSF